MGLKSGLTYMLICGAVSIVLAIIILWLNGSFEIIIAQVFNIPTTTANGVQWANDQTIAFGRGNYAEWALVVALPFVGYIYGFLAVNDFDREDQR